MEILELCILIYFDIALAMFLSFLITNIGITVVNNKTKERDTVTGISKLKIMFVISLLWIIFIFKFKINKEEG